MEGKMNNNLENIKKVARGNLRYLKMTTQIFFDSKKHVHPFFLYVKIHLRLFETQNKTFYYFSPKLLIGPLVHHVESVP